MMQHATKFRDEATAPDQAMHGSLRTGLDPKERLMVLGARLSRTLALARVLVENGRRLDLTGVEDGVGILCAQTLDLAAEDARDLLPTLKEVLVHLDLLSANLNAIPAPGLLPC